MAQRCHNPRCEFASGCSIRREDLTPPPQGAQRCDTGPGLAPAEAPPDKLRQGPVHFSVRHSRHGWIGRVSIEGQLGAGASDAIFALGGQLQNLAGLVIVVDSSGGSCVAGAALYCLVALAQEQWPVVCYVRRWCLSAPTLALVAADAAFSDPYGSLGGFGVLFPVCDGYAPATLVSPQSPTKHDGKAFASDGGRIYAPDPQDAEALVAELGKKYELDLAIVVKHTGTDPQRLRQYLDGRNLTPTEAMEVGLIDGIGSEDAAFNKLMNLIEKKKGQQL